MKILITTAPGLESLVKRECEKIGFTPKTVYDRCVIVEGTDDALAKLNLWLRTANKVYVIVSEGNAENFEDLYEITKRVDWKKYRPQNAPILVESVSHKSILTSEPAIQRVVKKAVIDGLVRTAGEIIPEMDSIPTFRVLCLIRENTGYILLDSSGDPLHKRGYRVDAGDAPIKETLAAAMVYLSNWKYRDPLLDPCCGAGTIPIEAAMIARNIAPGLRRHFAFENWNWYPEHHLNEAKDQAKARIYPSGGYTITGCDIDSEVLAKAEYNARVAGVGSDINWVQRDILESSDALTGFESTKTLISNPPYGERLTAENIDEIHRILSETFKTHGDVSGGVITSHDDFIYGTKNVLERRKLWNGSLECNYCYRKNGVLQRKK